MKTEIVTIGRPKAGFVVQGVDHYAKRLKNISPVKLVSVRPEPMTKSSLEAKVKSAEADRLLTRVDDNTIVVALDPQGREMTASELARRLGEWESSGKNRLAWLIGGPLGLDEKILDRADDIICLSRMTFTHELALLVVLEQIYRAVSIRTGLPFAK